MVGVKSTVLDLSSSTPLLLRPGGVTVEAIEDVIGKVESAMPPSSEPLRSPGMLAVHYAPRTHVRCSAISVGPNEALLAFGLSTAGRGFRFQFERKGRPGSGGLPPVHWSAQTR